MIRTARSGAVLEISIDNPPVNALGAGVRSGLVAGIAEAEIEVLRRRSGRDQRS